MAAIYMWIEDQEVIVTTTLYPIEVIDGVDFAISLVSGLTQEVIEDAYDFSVTVLDVGLIEVLISEGPFDDAYDFSVTVLDVGLEQVLISEGPFDDAYDFTVTVLDVGLELKLVTGLMPDEGIDFAISLVSGSMTPA